MEGVERIASQLLKRLGVDISEYLPREEHLDFWEKRKNYEGKKYTGDVKKTLAKGYYELTNQAVRKVIDTLDNRIRKIGEKAIVLNFYGVSGSMKTTLMKHIHSQIKYDILCYEVGEETKTVYPPEKVGELRPSCFVNCNRLWSKYKAYCDPQNLEVISPPIELHQLSTSRFIFLDDLLTENATESSRDFFRSTLVNIFDRIEDGEVLLFIFSSNYSIPEIANKYSKGDDESRKYLITRLQTAHTVLFPNKSFRPQNS